MWPWWYAVLAWSTLRWIDCSLRQACCLQRLLPVAAWWCGAGIATALLVLEADELEHSTFKVRDAYKADIEFAARTGFCTRELWTFIQVLRVHVYSDIQECEGVNSLTKHIADQCRGIKLPLLSARVQVKKALGLGTRGLRHKWSSVRPRAARLLQMCMMSSDRDSILTDATRWMDPPPADVHVSIAEGVKLDPTAVSRLPLFEQAILG
eukprot:6852316-Pyramimonas_sp.AAC.1